MKTFHTAQPVVRDVFGERFASKKDFLLLEVNMVRVPEPNVYLAICKPPELFRLRKWRQSVGSDNYAGVDAQQQFYASLDEEDVSHEEEATDDMCRWSGHCFAQSTLLHTVVPTL